MPIFTRGDRLEDVAVFQLKGDIVAGDGLVALIVYLYQPDLAGKGFGRRGARPGHGLDAIGFADEVIEIGIPHPGEPVVAPPGVPSCS